MLTARKKKLKQKKVDYQERDAQNMSFLQQRSHRLLLLRTELRRWRTATGGRAVLVEGVPPATLLRRRYEFLLHTDRTETRIME